MKPSDEKNLRKYFPHLARQENTYYVTKRKFDTSISERTSRHACNLKVEKKINLLCFTISLAGVPERVRTTTTLTKNEAQELLLFLNRVIPTLK